MKNLKVMVFIMLLVISSCGKKAEVKLTSDADFENAFSKANKFINGQQYEEARNLLDKIKASDTTDKYGPVAQLRLGDSYIKEEEPELAIEEYRRFLDFYPGHKYAPYAQYQIAMVFFNETGDSERGYASAREALKEFEALERIYPRNPYKDDVNARIQRCREVLADHEFMVGVFYYKKKAYSGALLRLLGLLETFPDYAKEADVFYHIAMVYKGLGDNKKASEYFKLILTKYPEGKIAKKAKTAMQGQ